MTTADSSSRAPRPAARSLFGLVLAVAGLVGLATLTAALFVWLRTQSAEAAVSQAQIAQAVEVYAQTGDLAQAQPRLPSGEVEDLARLFAQAEAAAPDEVTRLRVVALREAVGIPMVTLTLWDTLVSQNLIVMSVALAAVPLLAALFLNLLPKLQQLRPPKARRQPVVVRAEAEAGLSTELIAAAPVSPEAAAPTPVAAALPAGPGPVAAQAPAEQVPAAGQPAVEPKIQDILSSVFESEGVTIRYETLLRILDDIPASELLAASHQVAQQLQARSGLAADQEG